MAVIINEFEVIAEAPRATGDAAVSQGADATQVPAAPTITPDVIQSVWRRELERTARGYAG